jgi:hypothetical protein
MKKSINENVIILETGAKISVKDLKSKDLGITNLKGCIEAVISILIVILAIPSMPFSLFRLIRSFTKVLPSLVTVIKHHKVLLDEINDLSIDEIEELADFVLTKSDSVVSLEQVKSLLNWFKSLFK